MIKITMAGDLERSLEIAHAITHQYPDVLVTWADHSLKSDDDLNLSELSLYVAGQLDAFFQFEQLGMMSMTDIAGYLDMDITSIRTIKKSWMAGGIAARSNAVRNLLIADSQAHANMEDSN